MSTHPEPIESAEIPILEKQKAFQESIFEPTRIFDSIDEAMADPIRDHIPQAAPQRKVRGVLGILDQLDRENSNRRFNR